MNKQEIGKIKDMIFKETNIWCTAYPENKELLKKFSTKIRMQLGMFTEEEYEQEME